MQDSNYPQGGGNVEYGGPNHQGSGLAEFLTFRKMITPIIIQILFWLGVALCIIMGIIGIVAGSQSSYGGGSQVLAGVLFLFFGPVVWRVYCEMLIIFFRMNNTLLDIRRNTMK